jgi:hypothetical protein
MKLDIMRGRLFGSRIKEHSDSLRIHFQHNVSVEAVISEWLCSGKYE